MPTALEDTRPAIGTPTASGASPAAAAARGLWQHQLRLLRPLFLAVPLMLLVSVLGLEMMSLTHTVVAVESRWAKDVKDSVHLLNQYAYTCDRVLRSRYEATMARPRANAEGRTLLRGTPPDMDGAAAALQRAGGSPVNQHLRLMVLRYGGNLPMMGRVDQLWSDAAGMALEIDQLARKLDRHIDAAGCSDPATRQQLMLELSWVNARIGPKLEEFVSVVAVIHRRWHAAVLLLTLAGGGALLAMGLVQTRRMARANHAAALAVQAELTARRASIDAVRQTMQVLADAPTPAELSTVAATAGAEVHDILGQVQRLAARQRADHAALQTIFARSPDAFVSFDATGRVSHVSPAFDTLTGLTGDAALGCDERALVALLNRQARAGALLPVAPDGRLAATTGTWLLGLQGPQQRTLEVIAFQATDDAQPAVLCLRDVTRSVALDRLKGEFMTTAAHELRTPMASIFGFVELLRVRKMDEARRKDLLDIVHRQSRQMVSILDDLLDLSRLESRGRADLHCAPLDLAALARDAAAGFACPAGREAPLLAPGRRPLPAWADRDKLARVVNNLLSNAYKYSPAGGAVVMQLHEGVADDGSPRVGLSVQDQGLGLSAAQLQRVGERFYRADASGNIPGTGLGISLVREILQLHGGTLDIHSEVGVGSRFTAWLPAAMPNA